MFAKSRTATHYKPAPKLSQRIAEEAQLLAEEKWIIGALKKIKAQRNGLQIERLQLESMRAKLIASASKEQAPAESATQPAPDAASGAAPVSDTKLGTIQQPNPCSTDSIKPPNLDIDDDELCNTEELNLSVTNSVFNTNPFGTPCDEEEDDDDNIDNCVLDIDLLMSGK